MQNYLQQDPRRRKEGNGSEKICEITVESFPNMEEILVQEVQRLPQRFNSGTAILIHILIKLTKLNTKKIVKAIREKQ